MGSLEREGSQRGRKGKKKRKRKKKIKKNERNQKKKAAFLGEESFTTFAKLNPFTQQLNLGKVLATLCRRNYLHLLVARCRW